MNSPPNGRGKGATNKFTNRPRQPEIVEDVELFIDEQDGNKQLDLNSLKEEVFLKLLVLGDLGVGKSTLIKRYTGEEDEGDKVDYRVSVGTSFSVKRVELDGKSVFIQLWDVPGHERFGGMTKTYYKYAHGALIVFDLSRPETFEVSLLLLH